MQLTDQTLKWTKVATMNEKRYAMGAAAHHDVLIVAGGAGEKHQRLSSAECYVAATKNGI